MTFARLKKTLLVSAVALNCQFVNLFADDGDLPLTVVAQVDGDYFAESDYEYAVEGDYESDLVATHYPGRVSVVSDSITSDDDNRGNAAYSYEGYSDSNQSNTGAEVVSFRLDDRDSMVIPASHSLREHSFFKSFGGVSSCDKVCEPALPWWAHRNGVFGELLFLNAGNSDLIYAVEQTSPLANASPTGPLGIANIGQELGYRVGFSHAISPCSSLVGSYTRWDGDTFSSMLATGTNVLNSQLIHPSVATTGAASLESDATQEINFQFADAMVRKAYRAYDCGVINWNAGLRYGRLEQGLIGRQTVSVATGLTTVTTDIDFDGVGIIAGLDGERHSRSTGLYVYGKAMGSLLAGTWQADYSQVNQFGGGVIANSYKDFRISPVVDTELGLGWQTCEGRLRVSTGYLFSSWFNAVNNRDYIQGFRAGNLLELDNAVTFSGLTFRTELRF